MIRLDKLKLTPLYLNPVQMILRKFLWSIKCQKIFFGQFLSRKRKTFYIHIYLLIVIIIRTSRKYDNFGKHVTLSLFLVKISYYVIQIHFIVL